MGIISLKQKNPVRIIAKNFLLFGMVFFLCVASFAAYTQPVNAATEAELREKAKQLKAEIDNGNSKIQDLEGQAASLQAALEQINLQISQATKEIEFTEVKINELQIRLQAAEKELERQKTLLRESMRTLYKKTGVSTVELLVASDSFSQFVNEQEYLDRLKGAIQDSAQQVVILKKQIESEKQQQEELKTKQELQRGILTTKQQEQQDLLIQTKNEEASYQSLVADRKKQYDDSNRELQAMLARGNVVSQGRVAAGEVIGRVGSTGYSTGPHIHFQVKDGGFQNPRNYLSSMTWPTTGESYVSQEFGCVAPAGYYVDSCNGGQNSIHTGLDIAVAAGEPVVAAANGDIIFRGCKGGLGFVAVIQHDDGTQTWYPHMTTPSGQVYGNC